MADLLGITWLLAREAAALSLSASCMRVADQAWSLGLCALAEVLDHEAYVLQGEAAVCRGEVLRHPADMGACDPEEGCCGDCAVEYAAPEEDRC